METSINAAAKISILTNASSAVQYEQTAQLKADFAKSTSDGLLALAETPHFHNISPSVGFWVQFAEAFMTAACAQLDGGSFEVPYSSAQIEHWIQAKPPMLGAEYIDSELLIHLWQQMSHTLAHRISVSDLSPRGFVEKNYPRWADVGKICFHLAESNKNPATPFAFLVTYTTRSGDHARPQHRPLGLALKDTDEKGQEQHLVNLLRPIQRAAEKSRFIALALEQGSIYRMLNLDPEEALRIIYDIPIFEAAGIVCRVPNGWSHQKPAKAKVRVHLGGARRGRLGVDQLIDFDVSVAIDDAKLSSEEIQAILNNKSSMQLVRGRWIEVDHAKIHKVLGDWQAALNLVGESGLTMTQAMRLLSGFKQLNEDANTDPLDAEASQEWCEIIPGEALADALGQLRNPSANLAPQLQQLLEKHLRASLRPYQIAGVAWLKALQDLGLGGCLADDMGLGKTIQIIALLVIEKHSKKTQTPSLLVLPSSLLGNWAAELQKFAPSLRYFVAHPSDPGFDLKTKPAALNTYDLVITTYGMVKRLEWLAVVPWQFVFVDEAQAIKNAQSKQSQVVRQLNGQHRFALTGTPVENHVNDLWSLFDFCCPGLLGSGAEFRKAIKKLEESPSADFAPLRQLISPYLLRRRKTDKSIIADLPDKIEVNAYCTLSAAQIKLYQEQVEVLRASLKEATDDITRKGIVLASMMKFKQICNHPSQYLGDDRYDPEASAKFSKLSEICETIAAKQEKVLVFTQFREITDVLNHFMSRIFAREGLVLHGGTPVAKRQTYVNAFQDPDGPPFFVISLKAGGTGLNLTGASHVIHFDRWWNPAVENQATDRAFRIGQKKNVLVHKLVCRGTIEEKIDAMLSDKQKLADVLVNRSGGELSLTELSNDEIMAMIRLDISSLKGDD